MLFANALLSLSIVEWDQRPSRKNEFYASIVDRCINRIKSRTCTNGFTENLEIKYGAFYNGWLNYIRKEYMGSDLFQYSQYQDSIFQNYKKTSAQLAYLVKDSIFLIDSYRDAAWPGDNLVCIASLGEEYQELKREWLNSVFQLSETGANLIHHFDSRPAEARGSSLALMQYFISQIDTSMLSPFVASYDASFKEDLFGMQMVREHRVGGKEDYDSGPIINGYGAVATIVNIKGQAAIKNKKAFSSWRRLNAVTAPINMFSKKYYIFQQEVMFDLFMLWNAIEIQKNN